MVQKYFQKPYDKDAEIARKGKVSDSLLKELKNHTFFSGALPKTTGPELFNLVYLENAIQLSGNENVSKEDIMATLCNLTTDTIVDCILSLKNTSLPDEVFMSGGGMHNPAIVNKLKELFPNTTFLKTDDIGINGDAKEAVLFATLANEAIVGGHTDFGKRGGVPSVTMGKISFPN